MMKRENKLAESIAQNLNETGKASIFGVGEITYIKYKNPKVFSGEGKKLNIRPYDSFKKNLK